MSQLTIKQEKFCHAYIETGNASEAYRMVYDCDNMQASTINRKAAELLENGKITARIKQLQDELKALTDLCLEFYDKGRRDEHNTIVELAKKVFDEREAKKRPRSINNIYIISKPYSRFLF